MGKNTDLRELSTRFVMSTLGGERRWKRIAVWSVVGVVVAGGAAWAGMYVLGANEAAALHKDWASLGGCLLGGPLAAGDTPASRLRALQLGEAIVPVDKRAPAGKDGWPAVCAPSAAKVAEHAQAAEAGGTELRASATALATALRDDTMGTGDHRKLVSQLWKDAERAQLRGAPGPRDPLTPAPAAARFDAEAYEQLSRPFGKDLTLGSVRPEASTGESVRFLVDDRGIPSGPVLCTTTSAGAALECRRLSTEAAAQSPSLRLYGTTDGAERPLVLAGDRGDAGVFRAQGAALLTGATAYGATVDKDGRVRLLVRRSGQRELSLLEQAASGAPLSELSALGAGDIDNLNDAALAYDWLLYRSGAKAALPGHLFARHFGVAGADVDAGELAGPAPGAAEREPRFAACRAAATTALRIRGGDADFVSFLGDERWSSPVRLAARAGVMVCHAGQAWVTQLSHSDGAERDAVSIELARCGTGGCTASQVGLLQALGRVSELLPQDPSGVAAATVGGKLLVVWSAGSLGVHLRAAAPDELSSAPDVLLVDAVDPATGESTIANVRLLPASSFAVLLLGGKSGVVAFRVDSSGVVTPLRATF